MNRRPLFLFFVLVPMMLFAVKEAFPQAELTTQTRHEKKLQFNEYYEAQLAQLIREVPKAPEKPWSLSVGASYGHDSNATVSPSRTGDFFTEEALDFSADFDRWGLDAAGSFTSYHDEAESDYVDSSIVPFVSFDLGESFRLREEVTLGYTQYNQDEDLRYFTHGVKSTLTQTLTPRVEHDLYFDFQFKDFTDRNALAADNTELSKNRNDRYHEAGYSLRVQTGALWGMTGAWKINRSNDNFQDFNDYRGYKVAGFFYQEVGDRFSFVFLTGYDHKRYDQRAFGGGEGVERDHYFYVNPLFYVNLSDRVSVVCSYLYTRNASNDAQQAYFGHTVTVGLNAAL